MKKKGPKFGGVRTSLAKLPNDYGHFDTQVIKMSLMIERAQIR